MGFDSESKALMLGAERSVNQLFVAKGLKHHTILKTEMHFFFKLALLVQEARITIKA